MNWLQEELGKWATAAFGDASKKHRKKRGLIVLEEAAEFAQALDVPLEKAIEQIKHVYSRPVGEVPQEIAGVLNATYLAADALGLDAEKLATEELSRAWANIDVIIAKNKHKVKIDEGWES